MPNSHQPKTFPLLTREGKKTDNCVQTKFSGFNRAPVGCYHFSRATPWWRPFHRALHLEFNHSYCESIQWGQLDIFPLLCFCIERLIITHSRHHLSHHQSSYERSCRQNAGFGILGPGQTTASSAHSRLQFSGRSLTIPCSQRQFCRGSPGQQYTFSLLNESLSLDFPGSETLFSSTRE